MSPILATVLSLCLFDSFALPGGTVVQRVSLFGYSVAGEVLDLEQAARVASLEAALAVPSPTSIEAPKSEPTRSVFRKDALTPLPVVDLPDEEGVIAEAYEALEQLAQRAEEAAPEHVEAPAEQLAQRAEEAAPERVVEQLEEEPAAELPERLVELDPDFAPEPTELAGPDPELLEEPAPSSPAPTAADLEDEQLAQLAEARAEAPPSSPPAAVAAPGDVVAVARPCTACNGGSRNRRGGCRRCCGRHVRLWVNNREAVPEHGWRAGSDEERLVAVGELADLLPTLGRDGAVRGALTLFSATVAGASPETRTAALARWNAARERIGTA